MGWLTGQLTAQYLSCVSLRTTGKNWSVYALPGTTCQTRLRELQAMEDIPQNEDLTLHIPINLTEDCEGDR